VLVRRAAVIETLGAVTMLCVDKTGTLTENRMSVAGIWADGIYYPVAPDLALPAPAIDVAHLAAFASAVHATDPMDRAVRQLAETAVPIRKPPSLGALVATYPLRPGRLAVIHVHELDEGRSLFAAKGAPEAIFDLCRMDATVRATMHGVVTGLAEKGLRILGVASATHDGAPTDDPTTVNYRFAGFIAFLDPLRSDVPRALAEARRAGIGVTMITGDYPQTALEIARQAGIDRSAGVLTGKDLASLSSESLRDRLRRVRIFARIRPEQKLELVNAFKANGEVVAMTGDGVNDAPALETAHIGIAMGERGTDVAREAADLILLDDSFASIVGGVRLGRRIFANLRKALVYVTAVHIPTATVALLPILFGLPPVLYPMHVILMEMVIDPICSLVFEAEPSEKRAMERPPRPAGEGLFGRRQALLALAQGLIVSVGVLLVYVFALNRDLPVEEARGMAFATLVGANLVLAFADSAEAGTSFFDRRRIVFWSISFVTAVVLAVILFVPPASAVFQVARPSSGALAAALGVALVAGGWFGFIRRIGVLRSLK
ncbi:MAG TPA: cation-translocating P-type ATPase, partial [Bauldia sp.]|nr:cation-translocating P-type ATPase [Bauldia sp.]